MPLTQVQGGMILPSTTLTTPIVATTMGVGGATPASSGSGITFPATQSASTDANTLDDYEEGTFTPIMFSGISSPSYTVQYGVYTKVGRFVSYTIRLALNAGTAGGSTIDIRGLPFTSNSDSSYFSGSFFVYVASSIVNSVSTNLPTIFMPNTSASIQFYRTDGNGFLGTQLVNAATFDVYIVGSYFTS